MLQFISASYQILQHVTVYFSRLQYNSVCYSMFQYVMVYISVLQYISVCYINFQYVTAYFSMSQYSSVRYHGISLLSIPGKVFARILLNRLTQHVEQFLPEAQCGFRAGRGTSDMIFSLRQIQEKCIKQNMPLYMIFVDFTKAFDTVNRSTLWMVLRKFGCPDQFTNLIAALHTGMKASVNLEGDFSAPFEITNSVKQGCVLAPTLFSIYLNMVMNHAFDGYDKGVWI